MPKPKPVTLVGYRRRAAVCYATHRIAEQFDERTIESMIRKKYKCSRIAANKIRCEAWSGIINTDESDRRERFQSMVAAARHLYATAFRRNRLAVCAQVLSQLRTMFGLDVPYIETGNEQVDKSERTTQDLRYFAEKGEWPEEVMERQKRERKVSANPLDQLV